MTITDQEQNKVALMYRALWACLILVCIPSISFAIVASVLFLILIITAYIVKRKSEDSNFIHNHMQYIIKTVWFSIFIFPVVTITIATLYMMPNIDNTSIMPCAQPLADHLLANPDQADMQTMYGYIAPCMNDFMIGNKQVFLIATIIAGLPILIYMTYRLMKGTMLTLQSKIHANPKSWL